MSETYADRIKIEEERKKEEAISLINDQIELEKKLISMYEDTSKEIQSKPVRYLLDMIKLDSMKHILTFQTTLEILQGESVMKEEKGEIIKGLYTHIELEKEAIEASKKIIRNEWIYQNAGLNELIKK